MRHKLSYCIITEHLIIVCPNKYTFPLTLNSKLLQTQKKLSDIKRFLMQLKFQVILNSFKCNNAVIFVFHYF